MKIKWEGIPESYWPDTEKPWRVTWGLGVFEDFATRREAQTFYEKQTAEMDGSGWPMPNEPFNAAEIEEDHDG